MSRRLLAILTLTAVACVEPSLEPATPQQQTKPSLTPPPPRTPPTEAVAAATTPGVADPSCEGIDTCQGESCCTRLRVPGDISIPAFELDKYELTVGRVERWVSAGKPVPAEGALLGRDASGRMIRWDSAWSVQDEDDLRGWERYDTWRIGKDDLPKNFIDWFTASAVCHFAGGRLPNDAEWRHVAVGGDEARPFPWGAEKQTPERAVYNCMGDGNKSCSLADILPVGSRPLGAGRWGHMDLAGSMFEWTLDAGGSPSTVNRGGGFCYIGGLDRRHDATKAAENVRRDAPATTSHMVGARCAFDVEGLDVVVASR